VLCSPTQHNSSINSSVSEIIYMVVIRVGQSTAITDVITYGNQILIVSPWRLASKVLFGRLVTRDVRNRFFNLGSVFENIP